MLFAVANDSFGLTYGTCIIAQRNKKIVMARLAKL